MDTMNHVSLDYYFKTRAGKKAKNSRDGLAVTIHVNTWISLVLRFARGEGTVDVGIVGRGAVGTPGRNIEQA